MDDVFLVCVVRFIQQISVIKVICADRWIPIDVVVMYVCAIVYIYTMQKHMGKYPNKIYNANLILSII